MNNQTSKPLTPEKNYHFNIIYHKSKSKYSKNKDTTLSKAVCEFFIEKASSWGYDKAFYEERDVLPGTNIFTQLFDVIQRSIFTVVIITEGFLENCWSKYCQLSAFKTLLDDPNSTTSRLIVILVGVSDTQIPNNLCLNHHVSFTKTDWKDDEIEWGKVQQIMDDPSIILGETQPGIRLHPERLTTHVPVHELCPSFTENTTTNFPVDLEFTKLKEAPRLSETMVVAVPPMHADDAHAILAPSNSFPETANFPNRQYSSTLESESDLFSNVTNERSISPNAIQNGAIDQDLDVDQPASYLSNDTLSSLTTNFLMKIQRPTFNKTTAIRCLHILHKLHRCTNPEQFYDRQ